MKVAYFTGLRKLVLSEVPDPKLNRPDAVLVRIDRVGICGSDVHYYLTGRIGDQVVSYPATVGHECAGTIVETGAAVASLRPGDRVAIDPAMVCGKCDQCHAKRWNTCRNLQFMGCPGGAPGAIAEYRVVPAENCLCIPDKLSLDQAALIEPLAIGLHAVRIGEVFPAARVVILGAGPIGLSVLLCAKAAAACTTYVTDLRDERLDVARRLGANWTGNACRDPIPAILAEREPLGVDLVFECSGDPACIEQGQRMLTPGGTLVIVGIPSGDRVTFDPHQMRRGELVFKSVRRQRDCVAPLIRMVSEGTIEPDPLLTHRFRLDQISEAFEMVANYRDGVVKAILDLTGAK